jgi:amino acid permease
VFLKNFLLSGGGEEVGVFEFSELSGHILGQRGANTVDFAIAFSSAGALLSYFLIIGTVLVDVTAHCQGGYCDVVFLTIMPVACFTLPLCLFRNFGHLAMASYISITVISLFCHAGDCRRTHNRD